MAGKDPYEGKFLCLGGVVGQVLTINNSRRREKIVIN